MNRATNEMKHYRVAVLRGGPSTEYDVSLKTGAAVLAALEEKPYDVVDVMISRSGDWLVDGFSRSPEAALAAADVVFLALHGSFGEDGTVQRILDRLGIPYTGSGAFASNVAMNKLLTKDMLAESGIKMARHMKVGRDIPKQNRLLDSIVELFGPDYVVKPINGGSSIDTHIVTGRAALEKALYDSLKKYEVVLVEERIIGREATAGVLENYRNEAVYKLPVIEIIPPSGSDFFDYTNKYDGSTQEICPGRFTKEEKEIIEQAAHKVHTTLELSQYSRSDFIIADDGVYFLEVNTLPGLTEQSLFPVSLEAVGCKYADFLDHLLTDALKHH